MVYSFFITQTANLFLIFENVKKQRTKYRTSIFPESFFLGIIYLTNYLSNFTIVFFVMKFISAAFSVKTENTGCIISLQKTVQNNGILCA